MEREQASKRSMRAFVHVRACVRHSSELPPPTLSPHPHTHATPMDDHGSG